MSVRRRLAALLLAVAAALPAAPAFASARPLYTYGSAIWRHAGRYASVPPKLIYAIALMESRTRMTDGKLRPYPWALCINGSPHFPDSRAEAERLLRSTLAAGETNVDIGTMQINWRVHGKRLDVDPTELLDPELNVLVGAHIFKEALDASAGDLATAVGRYHSWNPERSREYAAGVLELVREINDALAVPAGLPRAR